MAKLVNIMKDTTRAIRDALIKVIAEEAMAFFIKKASFLSWGPLANLAGELLTRLLRFLFDYTILGINLLAVEFITDARVSDLKDAIKRAKALKADATKEEMDAIDKKLEDAARKLIGINSSIVQL